MPTLDVVNQGTERDPCAEVRILHQSLTKALIGNFPSATLVPTPMTAIPIVAPRRTYGWRTWREPLFETLLAVAIGWLVTFIEGGGGKAMPPLHTFVRNGILGACIVIL